MDTGNEKAEDDPPTKRSNASTSGATSKSGGSTKNESDFDDFTEDEEEASSANIEFLLSKMKEPVDARPVDDSTEHGKRIIEKRLQNRLTRDARSVVFDNYSMPADQLASWPKCPAMASRELERQKYIAKLVTIMTDAKKLNATMADAKIRQIGNKKCKTYLRFY